VRQQWETILAFLQVSTEVSTVVVASRKCLFWPVSEADGLYCLEKGSPRAFAAPNDHAARVVACRRVFFVLDVTLLLSGCKNGKLIMYGLALRQVMIA